MKTLRRNLLSPRPRRLTPPPPRKPPRSFRTLFPPLLGALILLFLLPLLLGGCWGKRASGLKHRDLFTIPLGTLPGELDWFYREGFRMAGTAEIQTRDGLVYLSGGDAGKVMVFNSYGDLITYVYDPARNPGPALPDSGESSGSAVEWPFRSPGAIAAVENGILVEDGVENDRRVPNPDTGLLHDRVVLRFDKNGGFLGHLGREGFGGSPFPNITALNVREDGGIVVTSHVDDAWMSYWFDSSGVSTVTVRISADQLPGREDGEAVLYDVRPDPVDWKLHLRVDVYPEDEGTDRPEPRLYSLDLTTLLYSPPVILTYAGGDTENGVPAVPPKYLGTTVDGTHLMIAPEGPESFRLILVDHQGRITHNRRLEVSPDTVIYRRFGLQNNGLLSGIFFGPREASVVWWRVDRLISNG